MNKMIKGSVAGATGIALLMGGFGTYALWSDSETLAGDSITAGNLDMSAGDVSWSDGTSTVTVDANDPSNWTGLMVPGDTVTRTQAFSFTGAGKNLAGAIRFVPGAPSLSAVAHPSSGDDSFDVTVKVNGATVTQASPACWDFTVADVNQTATTTVAYKLLADRQDLQDATATLPNSTFTITQGDHC